MFDCNSKTDLTPIGSLSNLRSLEISNNETLTNISIIENKSSIEYVYLHNCANFTDISALKSLENLRDLHIYECGINEIVNAGDIIISDLYKYLQ